MLKIPPAPLLYLYELRVKHRSFCSLTQPIVTVESTNNSCFISVTAQLETVATMLLLWALGRTSGQLFSINRQIISEFSFTHHFIMKCFVVVFLNAPAPMYVFFEGLANFKLLPSCYFCKSNPRWVYKTTIIFVWGPKISQKKSKHFE